MKSTNKNTPSRNLRKLYALAVIVLILLVVLITLFFNSLVDGLFKNSWLHFTF